MMIIGIDLDDKNRVIVTYPDGINGTYHVEIDEQTFDNIFNQSIPYKYLDSVLVIDSTKQEYESLENQIGILNQRLRDTDDKVTKALEYQLQNKVIPDEIQQILNDRQNWYNEIDSLESQLKELS